VNLVRPLHGEVSGEVFGLVILVSAVLIIYPCAFVATGIGYWLFPALVRRGSVSRAWAAGFLIPLLVLFFTLNGTVQRRLSRSRPPSPLGDSLVWELLVFLTPYSLAVSLGLALSWGLPPWHRSRIRSGGSRDEILPPGVH